MPGTRLVVTSTGAILIRVDLDASFRQEFLDIPVGQAESRVLREGQCPWG